MKTKLNSIDVFISSALRDSYLSHDKLVPVSPVLRNMMIRKAQPKIQKPQQCSKYFNLSIKQCYRIVWSVEKTESKNPKFAKTNKRKLCFYQNVQCVMSQYLPKIKTLVS